MLFGQCGKIGPRSFGRRVTGSWLGKLMRRLFR